MTDNKLIAHGVGRRKTSVARVYLQKGKDKFTINHKDLVHFFPVQWSQETVLSPLVKTQTMGEFAVYVNVYGGGVTGQVEAIRLGIARALVEYKPELRSQLKQLGYLSRDARRVERKKYGHKKARKSFQFSKR